MLSKSFSSHGVGAPKKPTTDPIVDELSGKDMDNGSMNLSPQIESEPRSSLMVTAKPFTRPKQFKRQKRLNPTLIHFDSLFSGNEWSKYLVLKTERSITPPKIEYHILKRCPTKEISFRPIKDKEWLIETTTKLQSENLLTMTEIEHTKVEVSKHATMNSIKGTVVLPKYEGDDEEIDKKLVLECLQMRYENVEDLDLYNIPSKKQESSPIRIARIKFKGQELPSKIIIFGQNREVRPFVPTPMQCKNCSKYGHTAKRCLNDTICAYCASSEHKTRWNCGPPKCTNCGKDHHARSKECPFYMYNTELKILQDRTGMGIREAKLELRSKGFKDPSKDMSYRTAAQQNVNSKANENVNVEIPSNTNNKEPSSEPKGAEQNNLAQSIETPNSEIEIGRDEVVVHVPIRNSFEVLNQDDEEIPTLEVQMEEEIDMTGRKRLRDQNSPPKVNENSAANKKRIVKLNRQTPPESELLDDITPSPVYQSKYLNIMKKAKEKQEYKICECQQCSQKDATPEVGYHHDRCGCNNCFLKDCKETKPLTKDKLINIIRNFFSRKDSSESLTPLELHPEDCMCIKHLHYYRVNKISYLDNFLTKQGSNDSPNESSIDTEVSKTQTENLSTE